MAITLPLESVITLHPDGTSTVRHTKMITGDLNQATVEVLVPLIRGRSVEQLIRAVEQDDGGGAAENQ